MIYLKAANLGDVEKEYAAITQIPAEENGYVNHFHNNSYDEFKNVSLPYMINQSKGINMPEGYAPETFYFLWDDNEIVGLFKLRHHLNDTLRNTSGHIGYGILKQYRGKGYAAEGLRLLITLCKDILKEDEIYLSVAKNNIASLKVQQKNGAYIAKETETDYKTRIKIR